MDYRLISTEEQAFDLRFWKNAMKLNTSIPAIIDEFDSTTQMVSASPAIRVKYVNPDGTIQYIQCPKITNIPLALIKSSGLKITYPIEKGQNCTLIFSQRSIDNFLIEGGIQDPYDPNKGITTVIRCMDMSDAMCFPGVITLKEPISNYATDAIEIRSSDGTTKVSVKENSLKLQQGSASIDMTGGNIVMTATTITLNGKEWLSHQHTGVTSGNQTSGGVA